MHCAIERFKAKVLLIYTPDSKLLLIPSEYGTN